MDKISPHHIQIISKANFRPIKAKFDENTLIMLKKADRFRLFKFKISIFHRANQDNLKIAYKLLDQFPELEIETLRIFDGNKNILDTLFK